MKQIFKYLTIFSFLFSCSIPNKEDLYRESLDLRINKDLDGYGIVVVRFGEFVINRDSKIIKGGFGNVKICEDKDWGKCYNLSMYKSFDFGYRNSYNISFSDKYYALKLKAGTYYLKSLRFGIKKERDWVNIAFNKFHYKIRVKSSSIIYIGDISVEYKIQNAFPSSITVQNPLICCNLFFLYPFFIFYILDKVN